MNAPPTNLVLPVIVTQHAEESAFLWLLRDNAVHEPHYRLSDLVELDNRVEAHIDGLRVAGDAGWEICTEQLVWEEGGETFAAAVLALESGDDRRFQTVVDVATTGWSAARGLVSAIGWVQHERVAGRIAELMTTSSPTLRHIGIAGAAAHRLGGGRSLRECLEADHVPLRARAFRAVGELGAVVLQRELALGFADPDPDCRFFAAWSAALLGEDEAIPHLRAVAEAAGAHALAAATMVARERLPTQAAGWIDDLARSSDTRRLALGATGALGDPSRIPWLIEHMEEPALARPAGEAFSMITGVDLAYDDLEGNWPEGFTAGPTEDPEDDDVALDPDENLPWPAPVRIEAWWDGHRSEFESGRRYLAGHPITDAGLQHVLRQGTQRQRAAAAIELVRIHRGQPLFEVRAPGPRQRAMLKE